jgi:hypothetical protein
MSIKIHNGFILKNIKSLDDLQPFIDKLTHTFIPIANEIWTRNVVNDAVMNYDYDTINNIPYSESYMANAEEEIENDLILSLKKRIVSYLNLEILLYFNKINDKIIGLYFIHNAELREMFVNMDEIDEYNYINDSNDETIKKDWQTAIKNGRPENSMLGINIIQTEPRPININDIEKYIPCIDIRAKNVSEKILLETLDLRNNFESQQDVFDFLDSDEHKKSIIKKSKKIIKKLNKNINKDLLLQTKGK